MNSLLSLVDVYVNFSSPPGGEGGREGGREAGRVGGREGGNYFLLFCPMFSWHYQARLLILKPTSPQFRPNARICENIWFRYFYGNVDGECFVMCISRSIDSNDLFNLDNSTHCNTSNA